MNQVSELATLLKISDQLNKPILVPTDEDVAMVKLFAVEQEYRHGPIISVRQLLKDGLENPSSILVYNAAAVLEEILTTPGISYINVKSRFNVTGIDTLTFSDHRKEEAIT